LIASGKRGEALPVLKTVTGKIGDDAALATRLARAEFAVDPALAIATLTNWLTTHPSPELQFELGGLLIESKHYAEAIALHDARRILEPLLASGTPFEGREEAALLIKDIAAR